MEPLTDKLLDCGMEKLADEPSSAIWKGKDKVFLNGDWVGVCDNSLSFVADLRRSRRSRGIPPQVLRLSPCNQALYYLCPIIRVLDKMWIHSFLSCC